MLIDILELILDELLFVPSDIPRRALLWQSLTIPDEDLTDLNHRTAFLSRGEYEERRACLKALRAGSLVCTNWRYPTQTRLLHAVALHRPKKNDLLKALVSFLQRSVTVTVTGRNRHMPAVRSLSASLSTNHPAEVQPLYSFLSNNCHNLRRLTLIYFAPALYLPRISGSGSGAGAGCGSIPRLLPEGNRLTEFCLAVSSKSKDFRIQDEWNRAPEPRTAIAFFDLRRFLLSTLGLKKLVIVFGNDAGFSTLNDIDIDDEDSPITPPLPPFSLQHLETTRQEYPLTSSNPPSKSGLSSKLISSTKMRVVVQWWFLPFLGVWELGAGNH